MNTSNNIIALDHIFVSDPRISGGDWHVLNSRITCKFLSNLGLKKSIDNCPHLRRGQIREAIKFYRQCRGHLK